MQLLSFLNRKLLTWVLIVLFLMSLISTYFAFNSGFWFGIGWLLIQLLIAYLFYLNINSITNSLVNYLDSLGQRIGGSQQDALINMPIGILLLDSKDKIEWANKYLLNFFNKNIIGKKLEKTDSQLFDIYHQEDLPDDFFTINWQSAVFLAQVNQQAGIIYLVDINDYAKYKDKYFDEQIFLGNISVDNFDEISSDDSITSSISSQIFSKLSEWARENNLLLRKISNDRFFILGQVVDLNKMETDKFNILDSIRELKNENNQNIVISIGIAYDQSSITKLSQTAQNNLDLALSRGGDQVVVKQAEQDPRFYGAVNNTTNRRNRIRARTIGRTLTQIINQESKVYIVGHRNPDMDSIGSALGVWSLATQLGSQAYIILDQKNLNYDVEQVIKQIKQDDVNRQKEYQEQLKENPNLEKPISKSEYIISEREAFDQFDDNSILIMVDHSRPSISGGLQLIEKAESKVIIIDHHRRSAEETPNPPLLTYTESFASSTSELVVELIEYQDEKINLDRLEATSMLGGIMLDTQNFSENTSNRTYDAASFLKNNGADEKLLHDLTLESYDDVLERSHLISLAKIKNGIATVVAENELMYNPVLASQVANALLDLIGVSASFVIYRFSESQIGITARSNDKINVQLLMEKFDGGGHFNNAAAQIDSTDTGKIKEELDKYILEEQNS